MSDKKPDGCPHCGVSLVGEGWNDAEGNFYTHEKNNCLLSEWEFSNLDIAAWNRRTAPQASESTTSDADKLRRLREGMDKWGWCAEFGALAMEVLREPSAPAVQQQAATVPDEVRAAVIGYYEALSARQHGGVAQDCAFKRIECALGMNWDDWRAAAITDRRDGE